MSNHSNYERKTRDLPRDLYVAEPDWPGVINNLLRMKYRKAALARAMDTSRDRVYAIHEGRSVPTYGQGMYLLKLLEQEAA